MPRRARRCGGSSLIFSPQKITLPTCGRSAPEMQLIRVVFPEPFGPIRPNRSPLRISTLILSSAVKPPKVLVIASTCSRGASGAASFVMLASRTQAIARTQQPDDALGRDDHEQHQHDAEHQHVDLG